MEQIVSQGLSVGQLLRSGQQTTDLGISLGTYFEDGKRRYVWAHVADATPRTGVIVRKNTGNTGLVSVTGAHFPPAATERGYGDEVGNTTIRAYGLSVVSATWVAALQDGYFMVMSGTAAGVYPLDWIEVGGAGYSKFRVRGGISKPLSTGSRSRFLPNPYRGCVEFLTSVTNFGSQGVAAGVITQDGTTSGYQLLQTRGTGLLKAASATALDSGAGLMILYGSTVSTTDIASAVLVARSLGKPAIAKYCPADIFID